MRKLTIFTLAFFSVALSGYILSAAQGFFLPLVIACVVGYLIISLVEGIHSLQLMGRPVPYWLSYLGALGAFSVGIVIVVRMVGRNVAALMSSAPIYQERLEAFLAKAYGALGIAAPPSDIWKLFENIDFVSLTSNVVRMVTDVAGYAGIIVVYLLFILIEYGFFESKLNAFMAEEHKRNKTRKLLREISRQVQSYLRIKTFISLATACLSYLVLISVGVDFADFWAFIIFLLNFIPTIGSIVATIFPSLLALVQFDTLAPFVVVAVALTTIQFTVGSVLEPRIMGKSLNLSGLVIILFLTIWGKIWGVIGMFLCVPILVILNIILANFPQTRPIAIMLSQNGKLD